MRLYEIESGFVRISVDVQPTKVELGNQDISLLSRVDTA